MQRHLLREIRLNWKSGLTVALVSIPLSLSLAIASGATPIMGIITAIWAGLVAAILGGSEFNVVGPAGALSGILASFVLVHGMTLLPLVAILSGVLIFLCYLLRWDRYLVFIPSSVMHGFTLGVGLTIGFGQVNAALGLKGLPVHETLLENLRESIQHIGSVHWPAFVLFIVVLIGLFILVRVAPRVPGAVVAALIGICIGYFSDAHMLPFTVQTLLSKYGQFNATVIQLPHFAFSMIDGTILKTVFTVTIVAILETLLSAKIVDAMTGTRFNQKREMFGLAIANIASGLTGGLPATGVLARTAINAKSGATSRYSSGLNAVFVLVIVLTLFRGFQYLPLAVVASILVFAAIRMVESEHFIKLFRFDQSAFWLALLVALLTFGVDPMIGILVGAAIALLQFVQRLSRSQGEVTLHHRSRAMERVPLAMLSQYQQEDDVVVYRLAGELTYFNGAFHKDSIANVKARAIILSLRNLYYIDLDGMHFLQETVEECRKGGQCVLMSGVNDTIKPQLEKNTWFIGEEKSKEVFRSTTEALRSLGLS